MKDEQGRWCILRMSGGNTLPVARSLGEAGFDVWTPVVLDLKRTGPNRKEARRPVPLIPTIAFARADRLHELVVMSRAPALTHRRFNRETGRMELHGCPTFSVFRDQGHYPLIDDHQLDALRRAERSGRSKQGDHVFKAGDPVRCEQTSYGGMIGIVTTVRKHRIKVLWPEALHDWEFDACDLIPEKAAA
ncbi:hypothetical protein [Sphingobium sp. R-7]|uniref:hypothetical protein n=1 Tax=Sphingobium sp. R-7 TaxID=3375449 RepID=UPI00398BB144